MYSDRTLRKKLEHAPLVTVSGPWVRRVALEYLKGPAPDAPPGSGPDPLWPRGSRLHGARYTPKGDFDAVYLADSVETAALEAQAVFRQPNGALLLARSNPQVEVTVQGVIHHVLDLTDDDTVSLVGTDAQELSGAWRCRKDGSVAPTQRLGGVAYRGARIHGIRYASSKNPNGVCLCVFTERLQSVREWLEVIDASGTLCSRIP